MYSTNSYVYIYEQEITYPFVTNVAKISNICVAMPYANDAAIQLCLSANKTDVTITITKKIITIMRLNIFMCLRFFILKGLFTCSIGAFNHTKKTDNPARAMHTSVAAICEIPHKESNHIDVDIIKQRKCVFAWNPPAVFLRATKEKWYSMVCGTCLSQTEIISIEVMSIMLLYSE